MSARRAFIAGLVHETNSFSPIPTHAASFQADAFRPGPQYRPADSVDTLGYGVFAELCHAAGIDVRASLFASAQPSAPLEARARQAFDILWATREGRCRPTTFAWRVAVVGTYPTVAEPMKSVVARLREAQGQPRVLTLSVFHGFWLADTPFTGACVLATTDADPALARRIGEELAQSFIAAALSSPGGLGIDATLDAAEKERAYPVVLADRGDNAGGGAAGDSTFVLRRCSRAASARPRSHFSGIR
jgi:microcystin degradation protein MlrC